MTLNLNQSGNDFFNSQEGEHKKKYFTSNDFQEFENLFEEKIVNYINWKNKLCHYFFFINLQDFCSVWKKHIKITLILARLWNQYQYIFYIFLLNFIPIWSKVGNWSWFTFDVTADNFLIISLTFSSSTTAKIFK